MKKTPKQELMDQAKFDDAPSLLELMGAAKDWQKEWQGMPEFNMGNTEPAQKITVSFKSYDDAKKFGELLGLKVTRRTDSIWWPKQDDYIAPKNYLWVDENES